MSDASFLCPNGRENLHVEIAKTKKQHYVSNAAFGYNFYFWWPGALSNDALGAASSLTFFLYLDPSYWRSYCMKKVMPLSDTTIRNIKAGDSRKQLSDGDSLYLKLFVNGGAHG